jgi:RND family efflux transporter MFP subunit
MRFRPVALLLLVFPIALAFGSLPIWCTRTPRPEVQAVTAHRGVLRVQVATNGKVEPVHDIQVRARLDGRIVDIPDDAGRRVHAGDVIARLDESEVAAQLAGAESDRLAALEALRAATAAVAQIRQRAATDATLFRQGALTRQAFDASQTALQDAEAQLKYQQRDVPLRVSSLEHRIAELQAQREATVVRAPFDGTVYRVDAKKGQMVRVGDPLVALADLDHLRVRANIDQVDLGRVQPGQRVMVSANAFPGRKWSGVITEIVPNVVVKENRSVSEGLARLEPPMEGLVPGMTVDVDIVVTEAPDALQVPSDAVFYEAGQPYVYRIDGSRVHQTSVTLGLTSVAAAEITSGLDNGALVVAGPTNGLSDGMRVRVHSPDSPT